jgi:signal transduction histidine kinase
VSPFDAVLDGSTVVFVAALLLGDAVRSRRAWRAEFEARLVMLEEQREHATAQRISDERIRIAQELHDVSAHTLAVINVQASVAAELLTDSPRQAGQAIEEVRRAGREAMSELRATVGVLRQDGVAEAAGGMEPPAPGLDRLAELVRAYGSSGPRVEVRTEGERRTLPRVVETTAYRIVQESLTNVLRHADADRVDIVVEYRDDGLALEIRDDGGVNRPSAQPDQAGYGLRGMAERAAGLDGWLTAGPFDLPDTGVGGFRVRAWLPSGGAA